MGVLNKIRSSGNGAGLARSSPCVSTSTTNTAAGQAGPSSPKSTVSSSQLSVSTSGSGSPRSMTRASLSQQSPTVEAQPSPVLEDSRVTVKPKAGILVNSQYQQSTPVNTLSYNEPSRRQSLLFTSSTKRGASAGEDVSAGRQLSFGTPLANAVPRAASHSDLTSFDIHLPGAASSKPLQQEKRVAYATAFDGSVVRRRQITTPSSMNSQESTTVTTAPVSPSFNPVTASNSHAQPEFEYSRVYYSTPKHQKQRRGLRAILAL